MLSRLEGARRSVELLNAVAPREGAPRRPLSIASASTAAWAISKNELHDPVDEAPRVTPLGRAARLKGQFDRDSPNTTD
jgi:hypothetical protein